MILSDILSFKIQPLYGKGFGFVFRPKNMKIIGAI